MYHFIALIQFATSLPDIGLKEPVFPTDLVDWLIREKKHKEQKTAECELFLFSCLQASERLPPILCRPSIYMRISMRSRLSSATKRIRVKSVPAWLLLERTLCADTEASYLTARNATVVALFILISSRETSVPGSAPLRRK